MDWPGKKDALRLIQIPQTNFDQAAQPGITREIFSEAIGDLITVYLWMGGVRRGGLWFLRGGAYKR